MAFDLNTQMVSCDHSISLERYYVDSADFRTLKLAANPSLRFRAPINGQALVKLFVSGVSVPPGHPTLGWSILPDTNRVGTSDQFYKIMFNNPVRWFIPLIEISYTTLQDYCLKCSTTGQLNDLVPSNSGSVLHVTDTSKLVQSVLKLVLTSVCPFYPQFTCPVKTYIGRKMTGSVSEDDVSSSIVTALGNLINIQSAQQAFQALTPLETLRDVTNISVNMPDPMTIEVAASIVSYGTLNSVPVNFLLSSNYGLVGN